MDENQILLGIENDDMMDDEILEGLGRNARVGMSAGIKRVARGFAARKTQQASLQTPGQRFLNSKVANLDPATQKAVKSGNLRFGEGVYYVRKVITGLSGIQEVFQSTDTWDMTVGVTNLDKGKLPDYVNLALRRVEINYVTATGATAKTAQYAPMVNASTDDALINGEIEMKVNNRTIFKLPARQFLNPIKNGSPANGYDLKSMVDVKAGEDIQILIHFAGTMAGTTPECIEFVLIGDKTQLR